MQNCHPLECDLDLGHSGKFLRTGKVDQKDESWGHQGQTLELSYYSYLRLLPVALLFVSQRRLPLYILKTSIHIKCPKKHIFIFIFRQTYRQTDSTVAISVPPLG